MCRGRSAPSAAPDSPLRPIRSTTAPRARPTYGFRSTPWRPGCAAPIWPPTNGSDCWHIGSQAGVRSFFRRRSLVRHFGRQLDHEGALRRRGELPPPHHDDDRGRRREQLPRACKPAEITEREEEGALAAVEILPRRLEQPGGAQDVAFGLGGLPV